MSSWESFYTQKILTARNIQLIRNKNLVLKHWLLIADCDHGKIDTEWKNVADHNILEAKRTTSKNENKTESPIWFSQAQVALPILHRMNSWTVLVPYSFCSVLSRSQKVFDCMEMKCKPNPFPLLLHIMNASTLWSELTLSKLSLLTLTNCMKCDKDRFTWIVRQIHVIPGQTNWQRIQ